MTNVYWKELLGINKKFNIMKTLLCVKGKKNYFKLIETSPNSSEIYLEAENIVEKLLKSKDKITQIFFLNLDDFTYSLFWDFTEGFFYTTENYLKIDKVKFLKEILNEDLDSIVDSKPLFKSINNLINKCVLIPIDRFKNFTLSISYDEFIALYEDCEDMIQFVEEDSIESKIQDFDAITNDIIFGCYDDDDALDIKHALTELLLEQYT